MNTNETSTTLNSKTNQGRFAQGVFLELFNQEGTLNTPMWLSLRDKPVLTKHLDKATVFETSGDALNLLNQLDMSSLCPGTGTYISVNIRAYDRFSHAVFWKRLEEGKQRKQYDYSHHLIHIRQVLEELEKALLNGPKELVKTLPGELAVSVLDLSYAVNKHLDNLEAEEVQRIGSNKET